MRRIESTDAVAGGLAARRLRLLRSGFDRGGPNCVKKIGSRAIDQGRVASRLLNALDAFAVADLISRRATAEMAPLRLATATFV